jgi:hypothetical protein
MGKRRIAFLITLMLVTYAFVGSQFVLSVSGQSCNIIVNNADATNCVGVAGSADLNSLIGNVEQRFTVWYANDIYYVSVGPFSDVLLALMGQVEDRFVIRYANANILYRTAYPKGLANDTAPPQISGVVATNIGAGMVKITWLTNEFASSFLEYGVQSGVYTQNVTDPLYLKGHEIILSGLAAETTYYFRLTNTDRSDNVFQSQEFNFTVQTPPQSTVAYIPLIRR